MYVLAGIGCWVAAVRIADLLCRADDAALRAMAEMEIPPPNWDRFDELLRNCLNETRKP